MEASLGRTPPGPGKRLYRRCSPGVRAGAPRYHTENGLGLAPPSFPARPESPGQQGGGRGAVTSDVVRLPSPFGPRPLRGGAFSSRGRPCSLEEEPKPRSRGLRQGRDGVESALGPGRAASRARPPRPPLPLLRPRRRRRAVWRLRLRVGSRKLAGRGDHAQRRPGAQKGRGRRRPVRARARARVRARVGSDANGSRRVGRTGWIEW